MNQFGLKKIGQVAPNLFIECLYLEKCICESFQVEMSVIAPTVFFLSVDQGRFRLVHVIGIPFSS